MFLHLHASGCLEEQTRKVSRY